jgi:ribosomal protein S18 acetylase RimI-like enzyme
MTGPASVIRAATPGDAGAVTTLWALCGLTRPWNDPNSDFDLALNTPTSTVLIAEAEARIVGTVMAGFDGHRGWIYYLAVDPRRQRSGLGQALMQAAEVWLTGQGAPKLQLMVRAENTEALAFYAALGLETQTVTVLGRRLDGGAG